MSARPTTRTSRVLCGAEASQRARGRSAQALAEVGAGGQVSTSRPWTRLVEEPCVSRAMSATGHACSGSPACAYATARERRHVSPRRDRAAPQPAHSMAR
ncbi:hypothetical protein [Carbonactinospora thermoautotrophica]|uniref:hypothetical protein n=1 Tax=Carbonactinospora thermoautotrophica TaxID=1469144 RepID=UPI000A6A5E6E|nr:hypothetical protein [Carbonactinospora thermoautotrophica]